MRSEVGLFSLESEAGKVLATVTGIDKRAFFLTTAHSLPIHTEEPPCEISGALVIQRERKNVHLVKEWLDRDLALLYTPWTTLPEVFELRETKLRDGEKITVRAVVEYGKDKVSRLWRGSVDMKGTVDDPMFRIYIKPRMKLPNVKRGACGGPATDLHGSLVGILIGVLGKQLPIEDLLSDKMRKKLERNLSKAYARMVLRTKFNCKRLEILSILRTRSEIRSAINGHLRYLDLQRAEEERSARH